jgi:hypothetical protein
MKIDFEFLTPHGTFRDAIHLPDDHQLTDAQLEEIKQQRLNNWISLITTPVVEPEPEPLPENHVLVDGDLYRLLEGVPSSGAKLKEINGTWYQLV